MFGIGSTELLVILVVALLVLGPKSLASVSRTLGKVVGEFRRVSTDFQRTLNVEAAREEARQEAAKRREAAAQEARAAGRQPVTHQAEDNPLSGDAHLAPCPQVATTSSEKVTAENITPERDIAGPPPDSPLAKAIAKAKAQAAGQSGTANPTPGSAA